MKKLSLSIKIYISLVIILAILSAINVFLPQGPFLSQQKLPAPKPVLVLENAVTMLILYGILGFIGSKLSQKLGFADIWDLRVSNKERFLIPAFIGVGIGIFFIITESLANFII